MYVPDEESFSSSPSYSYPYGYNSYESTTFGDSVPFGGGGGDYGNGPFNPEHGFHFSAGDRDMPRYQEGPKSFLDWIMGDVKFESHSSR